MTNERLAEIINSLREIAGDELSGKIADLLAELITGVDGLNTTIVDGNKSIEGLKADKDLLISSNNKLLQQLGSSTDVAESSNDNDINEEQEEVINIADAFDEKGNFIQ